MNRLEVALRECESQKQAILDGCDTLIFLVDQNHRIIWANKSVEKLCTEPVGLQCNQVFCDDDFNCIRCQVTASFNAGKDYDKSMKSVVKAANDIGAYYRLHCSPVKNDSGEVENVVVFAEEVTERLNLLQQLRHSFTLDAIGTLAGGIAHDFNNILTPIMGYSEILRLDFSKRKDGDWADTLAYIGTITEAAKRAQDLVKQFLIYSGKAVSQESIIPLHSVISDSLRLVKATLPQHVKLNQSIDDTCGMVKADPFEIHQIIINLCKNASEAMDKESGEITVSLQKSYFSDSSEKWVEISVSDNGRGISEDRQQKIFEPYYTTKEKGQGTGMGLAIVHGVIHRLDGRINLDSKLGFGTTISLFIAVAEETAVRQGDVDLREYSGRGENILLVDDEEHVVKATGGMLRKLGYEVLEMTSAQQSLLHFLEAREKINLVITDLTMPGLTGIELCRKLKEINKDVLVLLYSGALEESEKDKAIEAGVDGFFLKPVTLIELARKVHQILH